jgi:hypothetical protein
MPAAGARRDDDPDVTLLRRLIVVISAIVIAILTAGMTLALGLLAPDLLSEHGDPGARTSIAVLFFLSSSLALKVGILPAFLITAVAEGYRIRSIAFYALCGAVVALLGFVMSGLASQLAPGGPAAALPREFAAVGLAGLLAGLAYWAVAGRNAGAWRPAGGRG